jgi:hypothetical protein
MHSRKQSAHELLIVAGESVALIVISTVVPKPRLGEALFFLCFRGSTILKRFLEEHGSDERCQGSVLTDVQPVRP